MIRSYNGQYKLFVNTDKIIILFSIISGKYQIMGVKAATVIAQIPTQNHTMNP